VSQCNGQSGSTASAMVRVAAQPVQWSEWQQSQCNGQSGSKASAMVRVAAQSVQWSEWQQSQCNGQSGSTASAMVRVAAQPVLYSKRPPPVFSPHKAPSIKPHTKSEKIILTIKYCDKQGRKFSSKFTTL
jgi:hypothetical protein